MLSLYCDISAFCNAGFDLMGVKEPFSSLTGYWDNGLICCTVMALIIFGGLGFLTLEDIRHNGRHWRHYRLQTKVILATTGILIVVPAVLFYLLEFRGDSWSYMTAGQKWLAAFFQSVTMRTAGFNSVDLGGMHGASKLFSSILMFIGASPASTGGGVKTTTVTVLALLVWSVIRGQNDVTIMKKRLPADLLRRALSIVVISLSVLLTTTVIVAVAENDRFPFIDLLFEMSSAVATVGVSATGTPNLSIVSRALIIPVMYFGRVGPLTLALALANKMNNASNRVKYPEEKVMIG